MKKVAVVVGGGRSLGEYLVQSLSDEGYKVMNLDINEKLANDACSKIKNSYPYKCDATSENDVIAVFEKIKKEHNRIDLVVYNAGFASSKKIVDFSEKEFNKCYEINLKGYFLVARESSKIMIETKTGGSIIEINSKSGKVGSKFNSGYSAAKFGAVGLTQSLALDLADDNIRVNALMLGNLLDSDMFESLIPSYAKKLGLKENEVKQYYIDKVPLKKGCTFEDVANMVIFYSSDKAKYCTGQSVNITGGQVMF